MTSDDPDQPPLVQDSCIIALVLHLTGNSLHKFALNKLLTLSLLYTGMVLPVY